MLPSATHWDWDRTLVPLPAPRPHRPTPVWDPRRKSPKLSCSLQRNSPFFAAASWGAPCWRPRKTARAQHEMCAMAGAPEAKGAPPEGVRRKGWESGSSEALPGWKGRQQGGDPGRRGWGKGPRRGNEVRGKVGWSRKGVGGRSTPETCKADRSVPGPRALTGQLPVRATRQRRRDRRSDISLASHTAARRRNDEAPGLRHGGRAKPLHWNAPNRDSATCWSEGAFRLSYLAYSDYISGPNYPQSVKQETMSQSHHKITRHVVTLCFFISNALSYHYLLMTKTKLWGRWVGS